MDYNAAAHTGTQGDKHAGVRSGADARHALGQSGHRGVIINIHRLVQVPLKFIPQGNVPPAQVRAENHVARFCIGQARNAHAYGLDILYAQASLCHGGAGTIRHIPDHFLVGSAHTGGKTVLGQDMPMFVHHAHLHTRATHINTNIDHRKSASVAS